MQENEENCIMLYQQQKGKDRGADHRNQLFCLAMVAKKLCCKGTPTSNKFVTCSKKP